MNNKFYEKNSDIDERYDLVLERINGFFEENELDEGYMDLFSTMAELTQSIDAVIKMVEDDTLDKRSLEDCIADANDLYGRFNKDIYEESFLNPAYAKKVLGDEMGGLLSLLYADYTSCIPMAFEGRKDYVTIYMELLVMVYGLIIMDKEDGLKYQIEDVKDAIYSFYHDYCENFDSERIVTQMSPECDFFADIVMNADLSDNRYLYKYGAYIGPNETGMAEHLRKKSKEEILSIAHTYVEGYRKGFEVTGKDMSIKEIVGIEYPIGFEAVVREAINEFKELGMSVTIIREGTTSLTGRGGRKRGCYSTSPNEQFDYDHSEDKSVYWTKHLIDRRLEVMKNAYESVKKNAASYGGPAVIEVFGDEPFAPVNKKENLKFSDKQNEYNVYFQQKASEIIYSFVNGEETSFTIIAFPVPAIGEKFDEIFDKTVEINNLDYDKYLKIQQNIIDVLDKGSRVHITGRGDNHTDLYVKLHQLDDAKKQTNFENCVADVNIPVGEVFTSPVLEGTDGLLHVTSVFLNGLEYKDLNISFENGMTKEYSCANFDTVAENKKFIFDHILHHHESLPMGEFAIGTNTTAFMMGQDYNIADKLPILIAEKTGPHFAVGDTCYSRAEDIPMMNPDGKECIARDNSVSILRKSQPEKAYFYCHTDITIPYYELGDIVVEGLDGNEYEIIKDGRFVVEGCEELNLAL